LIRKIIKGLSSIADTPDNTAEERRQHSFLIYIGALMSLGGLSWGSIALYSGLYFQAMIPLGYGVITCLNFLYLYLTKDFKRAQGLQIFLSLMLPFLFQLSLGGFVSSGAQIIWSITAILGAFTFKQNKSIIVWFVLYLVLVALSGFLDKTIQSLNLVEVPEYISILFFTINISAVSFIIFTLFYYFVGSERRYRDSLEVNLKNLKIAQNQLVEAEKMSALGGLVAGVAHEVNTPLGISITAASIFKHKIDALQKSIEANTLSKVELDEFIVDIKDADQILIKNLDRAALLVKNFKKISVDQSSEKLGDFELNSYMEEIVSTFNSELRHHDVTLEFQLSTEPIRMHSYPGAISQIIINLLQNAVFHAFEQTTDAKIILKTEIDNSHAIISCTDNGRGVRKEIVSKIFEPFVTTKRNNGGTGLGLNITYNLVTQHLGGVIYLDTTVDNGASFIIKIPCSIKGNNPQKSEDKHIYEI
jgi:signal transduction histidine kinase